MLNYFDFGLRDGVELEWMTKAILPSLKIDKYRAFGVEANPLFIEGCRAKFTDNPRVKIDNFAACDKNESVNLYLSHDLNNHSIYSTSSSVTDNFRKVPGRQVSKWIKRVAPNLEKEFNILKMNIGGAELDVINDLHKNDLLKHFQIFCGDWSSVNYVSELYDKIYDYEDILDEYKINVVRYSSNQPHLNEMIDQVIKEKYNEYVSKYSL